MKALIVDDSALMRRRIAQILEDGGFETFSARNGAEALSVIAEVAPDVVTLDINMPEMDGLTCLSRIMADHPTPVVMISSLTEEGALATLEAIELGAVDYVCKPGGTVSVGIDRAAEEILAKVTGAARARVRRSRNLRERLTANRARIMVTPRAPRAVRPTAEALVLIGASTGGPGTLEEILSALSPDFPLPILICQHMPATITPHFARRLDEVTPLPVQEVRRSTAIEPGQIYVGKGDADLVVMQRSGGLITTSVPSDRKIPWHPSVGRMVDSAMRHVTADALVGVMLTGMGDDGAAEMTALREAGGRTIAESEASCVVFGMPHALIAKGGAETVLPAEKIAARMTELANKAALACLQTA